MKTLRSGSLALLLCVLLFKTNAQTATVPPGAGTEASPYLISTLNHLYWVTQTPAQWVAGKYFLQTATINASSSSSWNSGQGFTPIGRQANPFKATYDGGGFSVSGVTTNRGIVDHGFFGYIESPAVIKNLTLSSPSITSTNPAFTHYTGGLVGWSKGTVTNCHILNGSVNGREYTAGLVAYNWGTIENSSSTANVSGAAAVGGIAGFNHSTTGIIRQCFSGGTITATSGTVGGLVGQNNGGRLENAYTYARVVGTGSGIGGAVGTGTGTVINCYARGLISLVGTTSNVGGFSGSLNSTLVSGCYWDTQTSGRSTSSAGTGRTTAQMKTLSTYSGWDFMCETANGTADIWLINSTLNSGYPSLSWQGGYSDNCFVWIGTNGTDFTQTGNWLKNIVPADGAEIYIGNTAVSDLHLDRNRSFSRVNFPATGGRNVVLGNYNLTVSRSAAGFSSSYVNTNGNGRLFASIANTASFVFPVGTNTYTPITITNNTGSTDIFSAGVENGVKTNGTSGNNYAAGGHVTRTWDIHKQNPNAGNGIDLVLTWNTGDVTGLFTSPILFHYGISWERLKGDFSFTGNTLKYKKYTGGFSPFAVLDVTTTLPVSWGNVSALKQQNKALVKWSTLTEEQTELFQVQHSTNGRDWKNLQTVAAAGNSNTVKNYQYLHEQPAGGSNYYRILQQDIDGRQSYSKIVSLQMNENRAAISVFPNPTNNGQVTVTNTTTGNLQVFNNTGALVKQVKVNAGNNSIDLSALPKGVYRLKLGDESASLLIK